MPLWRTSELDMINYVGMDAAIFMRFTRMCRNLFLVLSILGCTILLPVHLSKATAGDNSEWISLITPAKVNGDAQWAQVVVAWLFNIIICGFLWWNYRKVLQLRRQYFESEEYQNSLHARTLMVSISNYKLSILYHTRRILITYFIAL
jgi:calcium permeable stress-gated cation channel